jgi:hypothetical protein
VEFIADSEGAGNLKTRLLALSTALYEDFRLVVITLDKDDDAQVIFQTLNFGGKPLAAMDLVRNDVFHRARGNEDYVEKRWEVFDVDHGFWSAEANQGRIKKPRYDFYLAHTLAAEKGQDVSLGELYTAYRNFIRDEALGAPSAQLDVLTRYAIIYRNLVQQKGEDAFAKLAHRLSVFDMSTAYPLVFIIAHSMMSYEDKARSYEMIASYVIRRTLCYLTPKNYNRTFVALGASLRAKGISATVLGDEMLHLEGDSARFPSDDELREKIPAQPAYGWIARPRLRMILTELELDARDKFDEGVGIKADLTIEHVLPDSWREHWPLPDGRYAPSDLNESVDETMRTMIIQRERLKHTLGNLTLLTPAANPSLGKSSFVDKKVRLRNSLLNINQRIADRAAWDEAAIQERSLALAEQAIKLWPHPNIVRSDP